MHSPIGDVCWTYLQVSERTSCNTLQHTATHCNTPRIYRSQSEQAATHCNTPRIYRSHSEQAATHCNTLQHTATHHAFTGLRANKLQHTATHCNTLQHTTHLQVSERTSCKLISELGRRKDVTNALAVYSYLLSGVLKSKSMPPKQEKKHSEFGNHENVQTPWRIAPTICFVFVFIFVCVYICVYVHVYMYVYVYTYMWHPCTCLYICM